MINYKKYRIEKVEDRLKSEPWPVSYIDPIIRNKGSIHRIFKPTAEAVIEPCDVKINGTQVILDNFVVQLSDPLTVNGSQIKIQDISVVCGKLTFAMLNGIEKSVIIKTTNLTEYDFFERFIQPQIRNPLEENGWVFRGEEDTLIIERKDANKTT